MKRTKLAFLSTLAFPALLALAGDAPPSAPGMPPMPKPGKQHELIAAWAGTWDGVVKTWMAPGQPPMESKGVMVSKMMGGFWLNGDWTGEFMQQPFLGHELCGYHVNEKKYICYWADSSADFSMVMRGALSKDGHRIVSTGRGPGMDGKTMHNWRSIYDFTNPDQHIYTMLIQGTQGKMKGKWIKVMEITYTRRK